MLKLIFDSNSLITGCKCHIRDTPIINYFIGKCKIYIPNAVKVEVVDVGSAYIDSAYAKTLIEKGKISIKSLSEATDDILLHYKLGNGEREAIMLTCSLDGRHYRAFINEPKVVEGVSKHSLNLEESIERGKKCDN